MTKYIGKTFLIAPIVLLFSSCGNESRPNDTLLTNDVFVEVERGAVLNATVKDANGLLAKDYNNSNIYKFDTLPKYPLVVTGGIIKIDGDRNKSVLLDVKMSSYTNNITPITTILAESDMTKRASLEARLISDFGITKEELYSIPSKVKNSNLAILTNLLYVKAKQNHTSLENIFNYNISDSSLKNDFENLKSRVETNSSLMNDGRIDSLKLENYFYEQNSSLFTKMQDLAQLPKKEFLSSDNIEDIWKVGFDIKNQNFSDIKIGVKIIKHENDGSDDIGEFVYSGMDIVNGHISNPKRLEVYGKGDTENGSAWYDKSTDTILQNVFKVEDGKLLLNLGYAMKQQKFVSENTFKATSTYDIYITSSSNIFLYSFPITLNLIYNQYKFEAKEGMSGEIIIK
ncbi:MAG: hypothetical protein KN64_11545 [Sulfurovum sp. AS07-7]|nr:MAG: hypothetical protein KN64_11545 [Sulfurovum sp. AS07-7]